MFVQMFSREQMHRVFLSSVSVACVFEARKCSKLFVAPLWSILLQLFWVYSAVRLFLSSLSEIYQDELHKV